MAVQVMGESGIGRMVAPANMQRRQRSCYWRPVFDKNHNPVLDTDGKQVWTQTQLLPSDMIGREQYLAKGFRLIHPNDDPEVQAQDRMKAENESLKARLAEAEDKLSHSVELASVRHAGGRPPKNQ